MNGKQKEFLTKSGINLTDGLVYFSENERLYEKYLFRFLEEPTFPELFKAIEEDRREDARRAAHSLKGITATLGFTSLNTPVKALTRVITPRGVNYFRQIAEKLFLYRVFI